jgi:hypothetical protein
MMTAIQRSGWWPRAALVAVALALLVPAVEAQDGESVTIGVDLTGTALPGRTLTARANLEITDGSTFESYEWSQIGGARARLVGTRGRTLRVTLPFKARYHDELIRVLSEPPVGLDELPSNVPVPEGEFPAGLQNRWQVVGVNPFALEEAGLVTLELRVTTTSGVYVEHVEIHTTLPWKVSTSLPSVPIGNAVLLQGKEQDSYNWSLARPAGSSASLTFNTRRNPYFTPDIPGLYTLAVRDQAADQRIEIPIYAGTWRGVIVAQDDDGRPLAEGLCTACHSGGLIPDPFTPWMETGHAEIFTDHLNTSTHYGPQCFACHTVGYDPEVDNGGIDEASDYGDFLASGLLNNPGDNWTTVLREYPDTAQLANAQCEACHGPQNAEPRLDTPAHGWRPELNGEQPRVSLSSEVCASCHGEPLRHARYQQWQLSDHANYELAIDEGESGACSRCHTANGFLAWLPILLGEAPGDPLANIPVTWTSEETHPQTCATCHDPHAVGTTSGDDPNARVRISGDTPNLLAGFKVTGAGKAAICMTCHNSRRGLRNDATFPEVLMTDATTAPHGSVQTDMLMGENAYLINVGVRGPHSFIQDSCVTCHMEKTPPPDVLSYNQGGTNHTFFARKDICADCHGEILTADTIQSIVGAVLEDVEELLKDAYRDLIAEQIAAGNTISIGGQATITSVSQILAIELGEARGRQALGFRLTGGRVIDPLRIDDVRVIQPAPLPAAGIYDFADEGLIKAGWNYHLVHADGSRGIHNPRFALEALDGARDALGGVGGPRSRDLLALLP